MKSASSGIAFLFQRPREELRRPLQRLSLGEFILGYTSDNYQKSTSSNGTIYTNYGQPPGWRAYLETRGSHQRLQEGKAERRCMSERSCAFSLSGSSGQVNVQAASPLRWPGARRQWRSVPRWRMRSLAPASGRKWPARVDRAASPERGRFRVYP